MSAFVYPSERTEAIRPSLYLAVPKPAGTSHRRVYARLRLLLGTHLPIYRPSTSKDLADTDELWAQRALHQPYRLEPNGQTPGFDTMHSSKDINSSGYGPARTAAVVRLHCNGVCMNWRGFSPACSTTSSQTSRAAISSHIVLSFLDKKRQPVCFGSGSRV